VIFPELLLESLDFGFQRDGVLNNMSIICFQILIGPCENILVLSKQLEVGLSFFLRYSFSEVYIPWVLCGPKIHSFMEGTRAISLCAFRTFESFL
jgi:hypothetical protein